MLNRSIIRSCLVAGLVGAMGQMGCGAAMEAAPTASLRPDVMKLVEDVERTRMLLGAAMWQVHDVRNFALYDGNSPDSAAALDAESLRLYELLKPIDYGASSLLAAVDLDDDRSAGEDLRLLRGELTAAADEVLRHYRAVSELRERARRRLLERATGDGLVVRRVPGRAWDDPIRERQRQAGVQIGWRTNMAPPPTFREDSWNRMQKLDIRHQLRKGRMLGITHLTFKDPVLRWDRVETRKGRFDFAALDRMMAMAAEADMKVRLVLPTMGGGVPDWWLAERPQAVIPGQDGKSDLDLDRKSYDHDFMGPPSGQPLGPWYRARPVNLADGPTRERFTAYVRALAEHCRKAGHLDRVLSVSLELFHAGRHWRVPAGEDRRSYVLAHYAHVAEIARSAFAPVPLDLEVADGEAHHVDHDRTAHEWQSLGLTRAADVPAVASETPFFEDLMRAVALQAAGERLGRQPQAGPFFYQNCEYGFGTMLSVNYFTSLLRDGLWSEGWFGPEGILRWGYFPQVFAWNDRQLQWSGITNGYLANRQAHLLSAALANTRVEPADVILLLPSSGLDVDGSRTNRELVGWGWALTALKVPYDVVTESALARGVPARARLVVLPQAAGLGEEQARAVRRFVAGGGMVLASMVPAAEGGPASPLADVLGCDLLRRDGQAVSVDQTGVKGTWLQRTVARGMHSGKYNPVPAPDTGYPRADYNDGRAGLRQRYQVLAPTGGAKVVARYGSGEPAIVHNQFAKGRALALGYPYGNELLAADWTSIAFGKIYNGWARDEQMLGMVRWLRDTLAALGYERKTAVPEAWRYRLQRWEAAASSLSYPKGPAGGEPAWATVSTYLDPRPDRRIAEDHDEMDYAAELTWRDRPGLATRYLAVANRESAYAGERAAVQFWVMPHRFRIRIDDPAVRRVYDVAADAPVRLKRDAGGVSFETTVPPALGRLFAVSRGDTVELFEGAAFGGMSFDDIAGQAEAVAAGPKGDGGSAVLHEAEIHEWLAARKGGRLTICCGEEAYRPAADRLAGWLRERYGIAAEVTADDGRFEVVGKEHFQVAFHPAEAEVLIGSAWSNNTLASIDSTWPYNTGEAPATPAGRLTATYAWPGGRRGVVAMTREIDFRRADQTAFGLCYGDTRGFAPRGVDAAGKAHLRRRLLVLASTPAGAMDAIGRLAATRRRSVELRDYAKAGELEPLPLGKASLYRSPWRSNVRTVAAADALDGVGVYYKHTPNDWTEAQHTSVMKQLAACGVRRVRLAPHHTVYITADWKAPKDRELAALRNELRAAKAAGVRPCVVFVHIPPIGKSGTRELQDWWRQGELMPAGEVGSTAFAAYLDKTWQALTFILAEARSAGFTKPGSYDLEMGQNLWWGAPAVPRPLPGTGLEALRPGGRIYEFDLALIDRMRKAGFVEPTLWWGQTHHHFEQCDDRDVPAACAGRAISFYSGWSGTTGKTWLTGSLFERPPGPNDVWPVRPPLRFAEPAPAGLVLARPEGWMADRSRRDNLMELIRSSRTPVAITSLGTVPGEIDGADAGPLDGWQIKQRALTRSLAFWLNQGARMVLLHSAYEPGSRRGGEMAHSLIPNPIDPASFRWQDAGPLVALRAFCDGLAGAKPVAKPAELHFRYAVQPDPVLLPPKMTAGDLVALLAFQLDESRFAVAAYVVSPNIAERLRPLRMTLQVDRRITAAGAQLARPSRQMTGPAVVLERTKHTTTLSFDIHDDVTWVRFEAE